MIKAIITDLDGTILPHGGTISPETVRTLEEAATKRMTRIIATGRNLFAAMKVIPTDLPIDYLVFSSGAGIVRWHDKQVIFSEHLSQEEARNIADYLWNFNINFTIQREIPNNHLFYYTDIYPANEDYRKRLEMNRSFGQLISNSEDIQGQGTQFVMIVESRQVRLIEQIRADLSAYSVIRSTSPIDNTAIWIEIFPKTINKGHTCSHLLKQLGLSGKECAGIGNDYNDVDFLDICGVSGLVANAPNRLKPHYKSVASDRNNGFSEFLTNVFNNEHN